MTRYQLDTAHSTIEFSIRHLVISRVRGRFTNFAGVVDLDPEDITRSKVTVEIDASSITTDDPKRDAYLRSPEFFDVEKYPLISFVSERIEVDGHYLRVVGPLTMHGVTREVALRVEPLGSMKDPYRKGLIAFSASAAIDRLDFGLRWNHLFQAGGMLASLVGERVAIELDVRAARSVARAAA